VEERSYSFANEAGIRVPDRDEVWFTSSVINEETIISVLDLKTNIVAAANTSIPITNANGAISLMEASISPQMGMQLSPQPYTKSIPPPETPKS
jgi:hypothetical protein